MVRIYCFLFDPCWIWEIDEMFWDVLGWISTQNISEEWSFGDESCWEVLDSDSRTAAFG